MLYFYGFARKLSRIQYLKAVSVYETAFSFSDRLKSKIFMALM